LLTKEWKEMIYLCKKPIDMLKKYFPNLTEKQLRLYDEALALYLDWNSKINLISRKDTEHLLERHILHSLGIAKMIEFKPNTQVLDVGTGGGFPGIPLAIMFPQVQFHLVDSIGKKVKVVYDIADKLGLNNVIAQQVRAENVGGQFDFIVSRAVTRLPEFNKWIKNKIRKKGFNDLRNGIIYLKGGDILDEIHQTGKKYKILELSKEFEEDFFETKKVVYLFS
jgi:16S rRNA (guanine527-N7)-methyltransferase